MMEPNNVFEQNNNTIASLESQNFSDAVKSSAVALACHQAAEEVPSEEVPVHGFNGYCLDHYILHSNPTQDSFTYECAIPLSPAGVHPSNRTPILIFNAALAHHLFGESIDDLPSSLKVLQKAVQLYRLSYKFTTQENSKSVLFRFIVMNNIAAIEQRLGIVSSMDECFQHMQSVKELIDLGCALRLLHLEDFVNKVPTTAEHSPAA